jgi:hypothetical protein
MALDIQKEVSFLKQIQGIGKYLGAALQRIEDGVNGLGTHVGVDPAGTRPPPPPIQSLTVKTDGNGNVHAVVSDNNPIEKNLHWFVEHDTDPQFSKPHVVHLGVSRSMQPMNLPTKDDNGNPQVFHFRAYSQYPGGQPSAPINFGGETPTAVNPGGSGKMTFLSSTGSGTAQSSGEQGGSGFGKVLARPASTTAKRKPQ